MVYMLYDIILSRSFYNVLCVMWFVWHLSHIMWLWSVMSLSQIRYSLVVILGLNSVSGVQYKDMMIDRWWKVLTEIIDIVKSEV